MKTPKSAHLHAKFVKNSAMEGFAGTEPRVVAAVLLVLALGFSFWLVSHGVRNHPMRVMCINASRLLTCPTDEHCPADDFHNLTNDPGISCFAGASADDPEPAWLLGGDRNLPAGTVPRLLIPQNSLWW
jgi:hypothetical protein